MYKSPKGANNKKSLSTMKSNENLLPSISGNGTTRTTQIIIFTSNKKANNILIPITDRAVKAQHTYLLSILFFILTPQQWRCNRNYYTSNHYY